MPRLFLLLFIIFVLINMLSTARLHKCIIMYLIIPSSSRSSAPLCYSVTALEVWILSCLVMLFLAMLQFFIINTCSQKYKKDIYFNSDNCDTCETVDNEDILTSSTLTEDTFNNMRENPTKLNKLQTTIGHLPLIPTMKKCKLDRDSMFIFPLIFTSFTFIYCIFFFYFV